MNESLRKLIKKHEGLSLIPYKCPAGYDSIGYGWNFNANPLPTAIRAHLKECGSITAGMAEDLLELAIERSIHDCQRLYPDFDSYSENRKNALADMMFNMGYTTLSKFTRSNYYVRQRDWLAAAENFLKSKWARQVEKRATEVCLMLMEG